MTDDLTTVEDVAVWLWSDPSAEECDWAINELFDAHGRHRAMAIWSEAANLVERGRQ